MERNVSVERNVTMEKNVPKLRRIKLSIEQNVTVAKMSQTLRRATFVSMEKKVMTRNNVTDIEKRNYRW